MYLWIEHIYDPGLFYFIFGYETWVGASQEDNVFHEYSTNSGLLFILKASLHFFKDMFKTNFYM